MNIVFMGSPPIAAQALKALLDTEHNIQAVFTREKKPVGRKRVLTPTAVGALAQERSLTVHEPKTLKSDEWCEVIKQLSPDIIVVVAYGRILPKAILDIPKYGCINLHVSALPNYRGAAPIQRAIMNGDTTTGVTIMRMDEGLDTGDIIKTEHFDIQPNDNAQDIFDRTQQVGIPLLLQVLQDIKAGRAVYTPQQHSEATHAPPITKAELVCEVTMTAEKIHNTARGVYPFLQAPLTLCDTKCGLCETEVSNLTGAAGEVVATKPFTVACGEGALVINMLQPEGKKTMPGTAFAAGRRLKVGDKV